MTMAMIPGVMSYNSRTGYKCKHKCYNCCDQGYDPKGLSGVVSYFFHDI